MYSQHLKVQTVRNIEIVQHVEEAVRRILRKLRSLLFENIGVSPRRASSIFGQELIIPFFQNLSILNEGRPSFADLKNVWIKDEAFLYERKL